MKVRRKEDLIDRINQDFAWRQKELTNLRNDILTASEKKLPTYLRSGTVLLYAHWEGFIKNAAECYLAYVRSHGLRLNELDSAFLALALKQKLKTFESTSKSTIHVQWINYIFSSLEDKAQLTDENVIKTGSNLNYRILREILTTIGIDCSSFELKEKLIDLQLLNYRNTIAHGQFLLIDKSEYSTLHTEVTTMLSEIKDKIQNAAVLEKFRKTP
jgi:hypothetical protein